jgi:3-methyladenine DNA glycosylase AlkD
MSVAAQAADSLIVKARALPNHDVATLRALRRTVSREWRNEPGDIVLEAAGRIAQVPSLRWIAYELVRFHPGAFAGLDDALVDGFAVGLDSWDSVDAFGRTLSGPAWVAGRVGDGLIERWSNSSDRWLRRAALVSTVSLNRPNEGGRVDPPRTLAVCSRLVADRDDMVVKALSWALRELGRQDAAPVRAFLDKHDGALAPRVKREVGNKLRTGLKNPKRIAG